MLVLAQCTPFRSDETIVIEYVQAPCWSELLQQSHVYLAYLCTALLQTSDTLKACPTSFGTGFQEFDADKTLPVSVLSTEHKCMQVRDVKSMSWEQHVSIWKVCFHSKPMGILPITALPANARYLPGMS